MITPIIWVTIKVPDNGLNNKTIPTIIITIPDINETIYASDFLSSRYCKYINFSKALMIKHTPITAGTIFPINVGSRIKNKPTINNTTPTISNVLVTAKSLFLE